MSNNGTCGENATMMESIPVFKLRESMDSLSYKHGQLIEGTISLYGIEQQISVEITAPFARLSDLVPLASDLTDKIVFEAVEHARILGKRIPCGRKCATCCSYLVPLSIPEVIHLYEKIELLPSNRSREFWINSLSVAKQLLENGDAEVPNGQSTLEDLGQWYSNKQVACPFLENNLCGIYNDRPLACREYLVTTPASGCQPQLVNSAEKVELPFSVAECLSNVAAKLEGTSVEAIMLPLTLPWIEANQERINQLWSAQDMAQCFLDILAK